MITRRHIRRSLVWAGIGVGAIGIAGYILSLFGRVSMTSGDRIYGFGSGAISVHWVAGRSMPIEQLRYEDAGWLWLPWCDEHESPFNKAWRSGRLIIPYWILLAIGAAAAYRLLPAGYPRGRCRECGYSLEGVPQEQGRQRCPECGETQEAA